MSKFLSINLTTDEGEIIGYINIDQIVCIIPSLNKCILELSNGTKRIINENYEDLKSILTQMGYYFDE